MDATGRLGQPSVAGHDWAQRRLDRLAALQLDPRGAQSLIFELNFELCSVCNLRCKWCSLDSKIRPGLMTIDTFRRVLDEIRDEARFRVRVMNLHHSGDVLLHPKFAEFLDVISEEKTRWPEGQFPFVQMLTSATHLRGDKARALLESDAIDWLRFSVDGGNRKDMEAIRVGAKWDDVLGNINAFLDEADRRGKTIRTGLIAIFETPEPEISDEFRRLVSRVTNYMPRLPHNWVGKTDLGLPPPAARPTGFCTFILSQLVVLHDGKVTLCCADLNGDGVIGDLATESLYDIFRGAKRAQHIRLMKEGRRHDLPMCGTCDQE